MGISAVEAKALTAELAELSKLQSEALQKAVYLNISKQESAAYYRRSKRIGQIWELLASYRLSKPAR
jgi:hypothetical protein